MSRGVGWVPIVGALVNAGAAIAKPFVAKEAERERVLDDRRAALEVARANAAEAERTRNLWIGAAAVGAVGFLAWLWLRRR